MDKVYVKTTDFHNAYSQLIPLSNVKLQVDDLESQLSQLRDQMVVAETNGDQDGQERVLSSAEPIIYHFRESFKKILTEFEIKLNLLRLDLDYFTYLTKNHEIRDKKVIGYYSDRLRNGSKGLIDIIKEIIEILENEKSLSSQSEILARLQRVPNINRGLYEDFIGSLDGTASELEKTVAFWVDYDRIKVTREKWEKRMRKLFLFDQNVTS